jgi:hypothetical protein
MLHEVVRSIEEFENHLLVFQDLVGDVGPGDRYVEEAVDQFASLEVVSDNGPWLRTRGLTARHLNPYPIISTLRSPLHRVWPMYKSGRCEYIPLFLSSRSFTALSLDSTIIVLVPRIKL